MLTIWLWSLDDDEEMRCISPPHSWDLKRNDLTVGKNSIFEISSSLEMRRRDIEKKG